MRLAFNKRYFFYSDNFADRLSMNIYFNVTLSR
jgi:hypothetical protein